MKMYQISVLEELKDSKSDVNKNYLNLLHINNKNGARNLPQDFILHKHHQKCVANALPKSNVFSNYLLVCVNERS